MTEQKRKYCYFSCEDPMCLTLDKAGVPRVDKWRSLIMYLRGLNYHDYLSKNQKARIQALLVNLFKKKDYSEENFCTVLSQSNEIFSAPYIAKIEKAVDESQKLLKEFQQLTLERQGDIKNLEKNSVTAISSGKDPGEVITDIRSAFKKVVATMAQDHARMDHLCRTDELTGLNNRRSLDETLQNCISEAIEERTPLSIIMIDIDHFKKFNDDYGHRVGDQALATVGKITSAYIKQYRKTNNKPIFAARYGGEEFTIVLPDSAVDDSVIFADQLRCAIESYNFLIRNDSGTIVKTKISITASMGVAELPLVSLPASPIEFLFEQADKALYDAKSAGRNRVCRS